MENRCIFRRRSAALGLLMSLMFVSHYAVDASEIEKWLIMPGPVAAVHAETEAECDACHAPLSEVRQAELCVACHTEVGDDISSGSGFHGRMPEQDKTECAACHAEHEGRDMLIVDLDETTFDHNLTDFILRGAHTDAACKTCHADGELRRDAPTECDARCRATRGRSEGAMRHRPESVSRVSVNGEAMRAHREHRRQVADILMPLELYQDDLVPAITNLIQSKLPKNQALSSYANNVFRDWAWDNGESEASFAAVEEVLGQRDDIGSVLTLGAGACRLPYDIHRAYSPDLSVALDINPLLLLIGSRVIRGKSANLYEFPLTPCDPGRTGILQHCRAPAPIPFGSCGDLRFVLGDASNVPFASGSFDTVVTPWLIDIVPIDLRDFVPHINRLLADDGLWINTGTLAFFSTDPCRRYGEAEVREIVSENGFEIVAIDHRTIPYLQSPNASHGRYERIVSFAARKRRDTKPAVPKKWLVNRTESIPLSTDLATAASEHLLIAQVLAAIDGRRSVVAIAALVSKQYGLELEECIHAVSRILADAHCDSGEVDPWT